MELRGKFSGGQPNGPFGITGQVLGAWLRTRKLWCEVTGEPLLW